MNVAGGPVAYATGPDGGCARGADVEVSWICTQLHASDLGYSRLGAFGLRFEDAKSPTNELTT